MAKTDWFHETDYYYDPCYECRGLGDDYGFDDDGELIDRCFDCPCNSVRTEESQHETMDLADDEGEVSGDA